MAKQSRKRQKLHNDDKRDKKNGRREKAHRVPLGTPLVDNETEKDDEERRLESMLFGTKFMPMDVFGMEFMNSDDEGAGERPNGEEEGAGQLQHLSDSDVRAFSVMN